METLADIPVQKNYLGGEFRACRFTDIPILDPSLNRLMGYQAGTTDDDIACALQIAHETHKTGLWSQLGVERAEFLHRIADAIIPHVEELAYLESLNTGAVLHETTALIGILPVIFRNAANQIIDHPDLDKLSTKGTKNATIVELWHKPWGPALCLAPWNAPAPIACHKLASAIAAGAPAIVKPSEFTPFSIQRLFEIIAQTDLPVGVAQLIHGTSKEGGMMVKDDRIKAVSFTGGYAGGKAIAKACLEIMKPVQLELGGHNPFIIMDGADINEIADGLLESMTRLNGQWCRAVGQVFCPSHMKDDVIEAFLKLATDCVLGISTDLDSQMGPLIHRQHKDMLSRKILEYQTMGARIITPPQVDLGDCFMLPTLISNLPLDKDQEELFGPVATIHSYENTDQVVDAINRSRYGLAAYIYGPSEAGIMALGRRLEVGSVKGNGVTVTSLNPDAPRSAWGISGLGEEGNFETYRFFQGCSVVGITL